MFKAQYHWPKSWRGLFFQHIFLPFSKEFKARHTFIWASMLSSRQSYKIETGTGPRSLGELQCRMRNWMSVSQILVRYSLTLTPHWVSADCLKWPWVLKNHKVRLRRGALYMDTTKPEITGGKDLYFFPIFSLWYSNAWRPPEKMPLLSKEQMGSVPWLKNGSFWISCSIPDQITHAASLQSWNSNISGSGFVSLSLPSCTSLYSDRQYHLISCQSRLAGQLLLLSWIC